MLPFFFHFDLNQFDRANLEKSMFDKWIFSILKFAQIIIHTHCVGIGHPAHQWNECIIIVCVFEDIEK